MSGSANAEDNCTGKFWEGRFSSQACSIELAFSRQWLTWISIRFAPESPRRPKNQSSTSIYKRIRKLKGKGLDTEAKDKRKVPLRPFASLGGDKAAIPYRFDDYLALIDWTGRAVHADRRKPSMIDSHRSHNDSASIPKHGCARCGRTAMSLVGQ